MAIRIPLVVINGKVKELPLGDKFPNEVIATFVYEQVVNSDIWVVTHNMKKFPSVSVVLPNGKEVFGRVSYTSENILEIRFSKPISGKAFLN